MLIFCVLHRTTISSLPDADVKASANTPQILDCYNFVKFWVSWSGGVKVGQGRFGHGQFLEWPEGPSVSIAAVSLASFAGGNTNNVAEWLVEQAVGKQTHPKLRCVNVLRMKKFSAFKKFITPLLFLSHDLCERKFKGLQPQYELFHQIK